MDELSQTESAPCSGTDPEANTLIVNELLTFVSDKINTMPYDMLVKLLSDFYSDEDITTAKSILYDTAFCSRDTPRLIKRKGKDKNINNIQDIVNIFLEMPPSSLPSYVAKDLSHLPPLTINCFDVASLVKDIESLKLQTSILQQSYETVIKAELLTCQENNKNTPDDTIAEPVRHVYPDSVCASPTVHQMLDDTAAIDRGDREGSTGEPEGDDNDVIRLAAVQKHAPPSRSYADALRHRSLQSAGNRRRSHTQRASHRNPRPASSNQKRGADAITGTGSFGVLKSTGRGLESVNTRKRRSCTGIFVTRLARNTQPRDVIRHIEQETGMRCQCEPIQTKYDSYRSFCIRLNPSLHRRLLDPTVWPTGTLVREFLEST